MRTRDSRVVENKFLGDDEVILVVDDFQPVAQLLRDFLKNRGLQTFTAGSAQEFWQQFKKVPAALVLLDINLPDADGAKLIPEIKEACPDTAIIMLSAATDLHTAFECLRNGADDYLTKPVQVATFWEAIRKVLEKRRLQINNLRYQQQLEQANFRLQKLYDQSKVWHPLANGNPPTWASGWGQDSHGVWVEFTVEGKGGPVTQRMRWIPPGRFLMGSPKDEPGRWDGEGPQHRVTISQGFWLFDTPVTQALWLAVTGKNPSKFKAPDRPVEQVSWNDCQLFLKEINRKLPGLDLTLPAEAQWEYACRAGSRTALYSGPVEIIDDANAPAIDPIAWYAGNSGEGFELDNGQDISWLKKRQFTSSPCGTHPVGQKQPNDWGLYDMLGNVWEWVADPWHENYQDAPEDGRVWQEEEARKSDEPRRAVRGGSWGDGARLCRSAYRSRYEPDIRSVILGFRCARVQG